MKFHKEYSKKNFFQILAGGFKSIAIGMSNITLIPGKRYYELDMENYRNGFEKDKESLQEDWNNIGKDFAKVLGGSN